MAFIVVWEQVKLGGEYESKREDNSHWMDFKDSKLEIGDNEKFYLTVTIDLEKEEVEVFHMGKSICKNKCNKGYLDKEVICNSNIPFTVGIEVSGKPISANYSSFKLYGCRLYDRVLSESEIEKNYNDSKNLLNS